MLEVTNLDAVELFDANIQKENREERSAYIHSYHLASHNLFRAVTPNGKTQSPNQIRRAHQYQYRSQANLSGPRSRGVANEVMNDRGDWEGGVFRRSGFLLLFFFL